MINEYDELKTLLKRARMLTEQAGMNNMAKSIENNIESDEASDEIDTDEVKKDKSKTYRISG